MYYKKLKLSFKYCKNRLYRTFLVDENINLVDLGCAFVTALNGAYEHCFLFETKSKTYNPKAFMDEYVLENDVLMDDYCLKDLGNKFEFTYDTGDGWDFVATLTDTNIKIGEKEIDLIDGKGQGIWEDNIHTLYAYLDGEVDPNSLDIDEERGIYPPWNFELEKYSDFDSYDVKEDIEGFYEMYCIDKDEYKNDDIEDNFNLFPPGFYSLVTNEVGIIISNPDVKKVYDKLLEKYKPNKIKDLFIKEYLFINFKNAKDNKEFDIDKFIKAIKKID